PLAHLIGSVVFGYLLTHQKNLFVFAHLFVHRFTKRFSELYFSHRLFIVVDCISLSKKYSTQTYYKKSTFLNPCVSKLRKFRQPGIEVSDSLRTLPVGFIAALHIVGNSPHLENRHIEMLCCPEYGSPLHAFDIGRQPLHNVSDSTFIAMHRI